jgi:hypothetical protein
MLLGPSEILKFRLVQISVEMTYPLPGFKQGPKCDMRIIGHLYQCMWALRDIATPEGPDLNQTNCLV